MGDNKSYYNDIIFCTYLWGEKCTLLCFNRNNKMIVMVYPRLEYLIIFVIIGGIAIIYQFQLTKQYERIVALEYAQSHHMSSKTNVEYENVVNEDNLVLIYNRVPKTGSTSFVGVAYDLCKKNKFHVLHVNITANNHVLSLNNQYGIVTNITNWNTMKPALYHGHFAFLDFSKFGAPKPLFINLIRRPLDRFVSYYYFVRYGDNFRPYLIRKKHGNTVTFDECVARGNMDCDPSNMWLQVPFFCGHSANCWKPGNKWALNEAKKNLVNNYLLVGVTEELGDFLQILEASVPRMFKGAMDFYINSNKSHLRRTVQKEEPSEETIQKIKSSAVWQLENELYEFALDHFHFIKKNTLKNRLQKVMYEKIRPKQP